MVGPGIPGWFVGLFFLMVVIGIGTTVYRISLARSMARRAGLDPNDATAAALLTQNGLDATYLAASLRQGQQSAAPVQPRSTEDRLHELKRLHEQGLISATEYDDRRTAILADI